ncbi:initiator tRNA phosphoribosyl transferase family protein [Klebsormidium nitens]|uniref:Initiator tRNA phosphoribosyl transferase family protein n=1 Tax=Klebsormidium nitens TaxID=105231 RepID=A0A1Y1HXV4_KLENI|nr:initiator tRNA phosphoribosyl transferase family protein [Klebsormidium nitens]|eukprot:GAQ80688.1 initiator tRNA phosphoribosyl transferase family protein [Klebsormidium nitens]
MQAEDGPENLSIYKLSRLIKREQNDLYNSLRSIYADSLFVSEIRRLYPSLPLLANLRCGIWYSPHFDGSCYFKSTDGHTGNWSFSCTRLNIHVAELAARHGGCIIVDATRRGKRYPDSLSKTVPIWCCVLNRALEEIRREEGRGSEAKAGPKGLAERGLIRESGESEELRRDTGGRRRSLREDEGGVRSQNDESGGQSEANESAAAGFVVSLGGPATTNTDRDRCLQFGSQQDNSRGRGQDHKKQQDDAGEDVSLAVLSDKNLEGSELEAGSEGGIASGAVETETETGEEAEKVEDWMTLRLPLWLSPTEKAAIESRVEGWVEILKTSGADLRPLAGALRKPLRPLWVSQRTVIWLNEVADVSTLPFTPVICLSSSDPVALPGHVAGGGSGWSYVPGAGDDEESWSRGLSPAAFWRNVHHILDAGPSGCKGAVARLVEEERVRVALRSTGFGPVAESAREGHRAERKLDGTGGERVPDGSHGDPYGGNSIGREGREGTRRVPDRKNGVAGTEESTGEVERLSDEPGGRSTEASRNERAAPSVRGESAEDDVSTERGPSQNAGRTGSAAEAESVLSRSDGVLTESVGSYELSAGHRFPRPSRDEAHADDERRGGAVECYPYDDRGMRQSDGIGRGELGEAVEGSCGRLSFIGSTGLAVGGAACCEDPEVWRFVDAILDCSPAPHRGCAERKGQYVHLPIQGSKFDRRSLERHLPDAVRFCRTQFDVQNKVIIVCKDGYDVSVCVCLAVLLSCFDTRGNYARDCELRHVTKSMVRQGLAFLSSYYSDARPSRGNLKQVFHFVNESTDL